MTKLDTLNEAFSWELKRMQTWGESLAPDEGSKNPVKKILDEAWQKYFKYLVDANENVMRNCQEAKDGTISEEEAKNFIINLVRGDKECVDVRPQIEAFLESP